MGDSPHEQIANAVLCAVANNASAEQRAAANQLIIDVEADLATAVAFAPDLVAHANERVRHFGLSLVVQHVRRLWHTLDADQVSQTHRFVVGLLNNQVCALDSESRYVKEKIVDCIVEVVLRLWPQSWPNALEDVCAVSFSASDGQCEVVLLAVQCLVESVELLSRSQTSSVEDAFSQGT